VQLAPCCRPIPGDEVAGYLGRGEGLVVHRKACGKGQRLFEKDPDHWIDVSWSDELDRQFESSLAVLVKTGKGVLAQVASAISAAETDITHIEMSNEREGDTAELKLSISFRDTEHLNEVLRVIRRCSVVLKATRVCPSAN
jgi:GTP diphosphokinase / guanosine-3',5'-bis(diphosphate) 3'-diphosphatase